LGRPNVPSPPAILAKLSARRRSEFWNDYPEQQLQFAHTWSAESRDEYGAAASTLYHYFQGSASPGLPWQQFEIGNVHFFISDTRSQRDPIITDPQPGVPHFFQ
jgi:hypothetical protein